MKVIHISPFVRKFTAADFINLKDDDWSVKTARAILKQTKKYEIECWAVSSKIDGIKVIKKKRAIIKIFPAKEWVYKKGHSRLLIKELKNELKKDTIIHLHGYHNYIAYSIISSLKNKPIIAQDHGENHPLDLIRRNGKFFFLFPLLLIEELIERIIFKNINQFFALTKKEMKYLSKFINIYTAIYKGIAVIKADTHLIIFCLLSGKNRSIAAPITGIKIIHERI